MNVVRHISGYGLFLAGCSLCLAILAGVGAYAAPATGAVVVADVPTPRANPLKSHKTAPAAAAGPATPAADSADPIASLLDSAADDGNPKVSEDSDTPEAAAAPAPAPVRPRVVGKPDLNAVGLRYALKFLDDGEVGAATAAAYALPNPIDVKIVNWLVATSGNPEVPASRIADIWKSLPDWPGRTLLQIRFEEAMGREKPPPATVIQAMAGRTPAGPAGTLLLTRAYLATGKQREAQDLIRAYWRNANFSDQIEAGIIDEFGGLLTPADNKARMDRLLYDESTSAALKASKRLDQNQQALAAAVVAVIKGQNAEKLLAAVPPATRRDPLYIFAKIQYLRHAKKLDEAVALMLSAPRDPKLIDGDAWWVERRLLSRMLIDKGDAKTAYRIAAAHSAQSSSAVAEAEFHAGWYALEFLHDPATASQHFARIQAVSTMPLSQSRAEYWLGRAAVAAGNNAEATAQFKRAAAYSTTFYGQLALARLGVKKLPISAPPRPDATVQARFEGRELVQVIKRLEASDHDDRVDIFYRALADKLTDPGELALLAGMAEQEGEHQRALQVGKVAASRGLPVDSLAFPTAAIPASARTTPVGRPVVYAIARQESAFNPEAVSSAGARGLLQLMPATAKKTASSVGLPFSQARLTSDPAYNTALGAAHLGELYANFGGSYVMTFAAYNAGASRVRAWVAIYGDPRDPNVDVVNWIEHIPFTETRNYVQRTMENLQVYRARLGSSSLRIDADLKRGPLS